MMLKALELCGFKVFSEPRCVEFGDGVNLFYGANRAGKSSILGAMVIALFGLPRSGAKGLSKQLIFSWTKPDNFETEVTYLCEAGLFKIRRDLNKGKAAIYSSAGADDFELISHDKNFVSKKVAEHTGIDDISVFLSTCCIRQGELPLIADNLEKVGQAVESILSGAEGVSALSVLRALEQKRGDFKPRDSRDLRPANPREYERLSSEENRLSSELNEIRQKKQRAEEARQELSRLDESIPKLIQSQDELGNLLGKYEEKARLDDEINKLKKELKEDNTRIAGVEKREAEISRSEEKLSSRNHKLAAWIEVAENGFRAWEISKAKAAETVMKKKAALEALNKEAAEKKSKAPSPVKVKALLFAGFALLICSLILAAAGWAEVYWWLAAGVAALALLAWHLFLLTNKRRFDVSSEVVRIEMLSDEIDQEEAAIKSYEDKMSAFLRELGLKDSDELRRSCDEHRALIREKERLRSEVRGLLEGSKFEDLKARRDEKLLALNQNEMRLKSQALLLFAPDAEEVERWKKELEELDLKIEANKKRKSELDGMLKELDSDDRSSEAWEERLSSVRARLCEIDKLSEACSIAIDYLKRAIDEVRGECLPELENRVRAIFCGLAADEFTGVDLLGSWPRILMSTRSKSDIGLESLSAGTIDQLYLSLRLAAIDVIGGSSKLPLILDDPLVNCDGKSKEAILKMIADASKSHQVIFFTCHEEFRDWAESLEKSALADAKIFEIGADHGIAER